MTSLEYSWYVVIHNLIECPYVVEIPEVSVDAKHYGELLRFLLVVHFRQFFV